MTDAQRLDEIKALMEHDPLHVENNYHVIIDEIIAKLDVANQTIADLQRQVSELTKERDDIQRQVSNLTSAYSNRVDKYVRVEQERDDYKVTLKLMSRNDHHLSRRYMELATQTLAKYAPRQEDGE